MMESAGRGTIDDVIMPHATRSRIARALAMLRGKTVEMPGRKHDNLPVWRGCALFLTPLPLWERVPEWRREPSEGG